jgi:hypothetical protein
VPPEKCYPVLSLDIPERLFDSATGPRRNLRKIGLAVQGL